MTYRCTECDATYATLAAAGRCHWGIGGVVEVDPRYDRGEGVCPDWEDAVAWRQDREG